MPCLYYVIFFQTFKIKYHTKLLYSGQQVKEKFQNNHNYPNLIKYGKYLRTGQTLDIQVSTNCLTYHS